MGRFYRRIRTKYLCHWIENTYNYHPKIFERTRYRTDIVTIIGTL